jgi:D-3-phosphoglycerate dehydrogenase / 2-oxoglutarate reductase
VIIFASGPSGPAEELQALSDAGHVLKLGRPQTLQDRKPFSDQELIKSCHRAQILMASHLESVTDNVLKQLPDLIMVIVPFIGVDRVDLDSATKLGIAVANSPTPENFISVAEAAIGLSLALLKRIKHNETRLRNGLWGGLNDRGDLLFKKTFGIVGLGRSGVEVARRLEPWGVRLLASDPYADPLRAAQLNVELVDLPTLLAESDVVSLHATVTPESRHLICEQTLALMKQDAILVNTARGALVDEIALVRALNEGKIRAAALDSFQQEPLPAGHVLRNVDPARLVLTPHNVCQSQDGRKAGIALAIEQILEVGNGCTPRHLLNSSVTSHWRGFQQINL